MCGEVTRLQMFRNSLPETKPPTRRNRQCQRVRLPFHMQDAPLNDNLASCWQVSRVLVQKCHILISITHMSKRRNTEFLQFHCKGDCYSQAMLEASAGLTWLASHLKNYCQVRPLAAYICVFFWTARARQAPDEHPRDDCVVSSEGGLTIRC